jgi:HEAT repeat protein
LCWFAALPILAEEPATDDPLIGIHRLSRWKQLLNDEDANLRSIAALSLGRIRSPKAAPALLEALNDGDYSVRSSAALALGLIGSDAAVEALIKTINNEGEDELVRGSAAQALGVSCSTRNSHAKQAIPVLISAFQVRGTNGSVRQMAVRGLADIGPEAVPALIETIRNCNRYQGEVLIAAADALRQIGPPAAPALAELLTETRGDQRKWVALTLAAIGPTVDAVPALIETLQEDDDPITRSAAARALGKVGPGAKPAAAVLIEALQEARVRRWAVYALGRIGPDARAAVPAMIERLQDEDMYVRRATASALGGIGPAARAALPALKELLHDPNRRIAEAAAEAIGQIE